MTLLIIFPVIITYLYLRVFSAYITKKRYKLLAIFVIALFTFSMPLSMLITNALDFKSIFIVRLTSLVFGIFGFSLAFLLIRDVIYILVFLYNKVTGNAKKLLSSINSIKWVYATLAPAFLLSTFGLINAIQVPDVREVKVTIPNLPEDLKGFKLVQITDTHIGAGFDDKWLQEVVNKINALKADMIVGTGDIVDDSLKDIKDEIYPLLELSAPYGVYYVTGNHEYYAGAEEIINHFESLGLNVLVNESVVFDIGSAKLAVSGLPDLRHYRNKGTEGRDYDKTLANVPDDAVKILLDHQPVAAKENAKYGFDLQLSGHTHGGQVVFIQHLVASANNGYVVDMYNVDGMQLYVSRGTGLWGYGSLRLFVPPEITLFIFE